MDQCVSQRSLGKRFADLGVTSICSVLLFEAVVGCSGDSFSADEFERGQAGQASVGGTTANAGTSNGPFTVGGAAGSSATGGKNPPAVGGSSLGGSWAAGGSFAVAGSSAEGGSVSMGGNAGQEELPPGGFAGGVAAAGSAGDGAGGLVATGGAGASNAGASNAGTGGVGAAGAPLGGFGGFGGLVGFGGLGGFSGSGAGGVAGSAAGGLGGVGGVPVTLPFKENFEDGNVDGWNLQFLNAYSFSILAGTGANNTARSFQLTKTQNTGFCCDGYYRQFPAGLMPKTISIWLRADVAGTDAGYFRFSGTTDANQWLAYVYFYQTGLFMQAEQSLSIVYTTGRWYHVEFRNIDWNAHRFEYWVDDMQLATVNMRNPGTAVKRIDIYGRAASDTTPATAYFDEIELRP